ncbi:carbohydrate sulfotransferase 5-like [Bradysia coprophila]|uniref:carbohydrate sulfotransferase 5-like n=1 Tax=Bradysia coprophila TaxID=38358 RepID=UPI00187D9A28|nr:carbohydrate sulfotransferase 5-like [Bradysia coprophila]
MHRRNSVVIVTFTILCALMLIIYRPDISLFASESSFEEIDELNHVKAMGLVDISRSEIATEMKDFETTNEMLELSKMTPESNGIPIRNVILSTWNTGSSYLGDILNVIPGNYYFHEPLRHLGDIQIREQNTLLTEAMQLLDRVLKCNFTGLDQYMKHVIHDYNIGLSKLCGTVIPSNLCKTDATFLNAFCGIFPIQTMTEVRLRPAFVEPLLTDSELNVKIVLLIRDPRGIIASRKRDEWCAHSQECLDYKKLCQDLVFDAKAAQYLSTKYPERFKAIRYEDLSLNTFKVAKEVLDFYGLPLHKNVKQFLISHRLDVEHSILKSLNYKDTAFSWQSSLKFREIAKIQLQCTDALDLWGYQQVISVQELRGDSFYPLLEYPYST